MGLVLYHYDVKQSGEPLTRPELRVAPLRDTYHRLVRSVLSARAPAGQESFLRAGEVALLMDGGRKGNQAKLLSPWKEGTAKDGKTKKDEDEEEADAEGDDEEEDGDEERIKKPGFVPTILQLAYTQESITARRKVVRASPGSIRQVGWCHVVAHSRVNLPERQRLHYQGSTAGDLITGLEVPDLSRGWQTTWGDKKILYNKKNLIAVGGKTKGADGPTTEKKTYSIIVPTCYHPMPLLFYLEMLNIFFAELVIDLTPISAVFAWACFQSRVGYVAICFTSEHVDMLYDYLKGKMKEEIADSTSKLYNKDYAKAVGALEDKRGEPEDSGRGGKKNGRGRGSGGRGRGRKGKGKGRGKANADDEEPDVLPEGGDDGAAGEDDDDVGAGAGGDNDDDGVWDPFKGDNDDES